MFETDPEVHDVQSTRVPVDSLKIHQWASDNPHCRVYRDRWRASGSQRTLIDCRNLSKQNKEITKRGSGSPSGAARVALASRSNPENRLHLEETELRTNPFVSQCLDPRMVTETTASPVSQLESASSILDQSTVDVTVTIEQASPGIISKPEGVVGSAEPVGEKGKRNSLIGVISQQAGAVAKQARNTRVTFYSRGEDDRVYGFEKLGPQHRKYDVLIALTVSLMAVGGIMLYEINMLVAGCVLSLLDGISFCYLMADYESVPSRKMVLFTSAVTVVGVGVTLLVHVTVGLGLRILALAIVLIVGMRVAKIPMQIRPAYIYTFFVAAALALNLSSLWYSIGGFAVVVGPLLFASTEGIMRFLISFIPVPGLTPAQKGPLIAALCMMTSLFFAGIRLALFLTTWQTAETRNLVGNIIFTILSEIVIEGGVFPVYILPVFAQVFPFLRQLISREAMEEVLVYVSVSQVTEFIPAIATALLYVMFGTDFEVSGFLLVEVEGFHPYQDAILEGLAIHIAMEVVISYFAFYVSRKTGFRHCWVWSHPKVWVASVHEALQYAICPILAAVVLHNLGNGEDADESGSLSVSPYPSLSVDNWETLQNETAAEALAQWL
eukprot:Rmarinus@m.16597